MPQIVFNPLDSLQNIQLRIKTEHTSEKEMGAMHACAYAATADPCARVETVTIWRFTWRDAFFIQTARFLFFLSLSLDLDWGISIF